MHETQHRPEIRINVNGETKNSNSNEEYNNLVDNLINSEEQLNQLPKYGDVVDENNKAETADEEKENYLHKNWFGKKSCQPTKEQIEKYWRSILAVRRKLS